MQGASSQNGVYLWSRNTFKCLQRSNPTHLNSINSLPFQSPSLSCLVTVVLLLMGGNVLSKKVNISLRRKQGRAGKEFLMAALG